MPAPLAQPVLALAMQNIHQINTIDADNLSCMWTVFTKCKENLENGRRLENISWRLWYRETMLMDRSSECLKVPSMKLEREQNSAVDPILSSLAPDVQTKRAESSRAENPSALIDPTQDPLLASQSVVKMPKGVESSSPKSLMRHVSPLSFKRIISSLVPTGADINDWKLMNENKMKEASHSAPQPTTVAATVVDVAPSTSSYPENLLREQQQQQQQLELQQQELLLQQQQQQEEDQEQQQQEQQSVFSNPISQRTVDGAFTLLSQPAGGDRRQVHSASSSCRPRSVVMGFCASNNSERVQLKQQQQQQHQQQRGAKGKFFIDNYESESDEEEDVLTLTNNAFALRLKRDSLPRASGFRSIPPSLPENDCGNVSDTVEYEEQGSDWDEDAESNTHPLSEEDPFGRAFAHHTRPLPQQPPRRSLLSSLLAQKSQPQPFLRSSRSIYQDLSALSTSTSTSPASSPQAVPNVSRKTAAEQALRQSHIAPIRSPNTTRRDILCSELSESLRRNLLHERQHSNPPFPNATSKSGNDINALRGRYAEPQAGLNTTPTSTVFGGDKHLGWFESFRGW